MESSFKKLSEKFRVKTDDIRQEGFVPIFQLPLDVAIDTSGSTWSILSHFDRDGRRILEVSSNIVTNILKDKMPENVIAWNSEAALVPVSALRSSGGTDPTQLFPLLQSGCATLLITTDGEISSELVNQVIPLVRSSTLCNIIAIYVGPSKEIRPSQLNLAVFAPFIMEIPGVVLVFHFDGDNLRLLMKSIFADISVSPALPDLPSNIGDTTVWDDFPTINPDDLEKASLPRKVLASLSNTRMSTSDEVALPLYILWEREFWDVHLMVHELPRIFEHCNSLDDLIDLANAIQTFLLEVKLGNLGNHARIELRRIAQIWYKFAHEAMVRQLEPLLNDPGTQSLKVEADALYARLKRWTNGRERDVNKLQLQTRLRDIIRQLFVLNERIKETKRRTVDDVTQVYESFCRRLVDYDHKETVCTSYSLASLVDGNSRRAQRALITQNNTIKTEEWDLEDSVAAKCDICAVTATVVILLIALDDRQISDNTSDSSLNDAFSFGHKNCRYVSKALVCIHCASYLLLNHEDCPFSKRKLATMIPLVRYTPANAKKMSQNVSMWLFGGRKTGIELQALLAIVEVLREQENNFSKLNPFERELVFCISANFDGVLGTTQPLVAAIRRLFTAPIDFHSSDSYLVSMRNKSMNSTVTLGRLAIKYANVDVQDVTDYLQRLFFKTIISLSLDSCKTLGSSERLVFALQSDLYDMSTGLPILGSYKILLQPSDSLFLRELHAVELVKSSVRFADRLFTFDSLLYSVIWYRLSERLQFFRQGTEEFIVNFLREDKEHLEISNRILRYSAFKTRPLCKNEVFECLRQIHSKTFFPTDITHSVVFSSYAEAHLCSVASLCCAVCHNSFITTDELKEFGLDVANNVQIIENVRDRRNQHLRTYYEGSIKSGQYLSNVVRIVGTVLSDKGIIERKDIIDCIKKIRSKPTGSYIYRPDLLTQIGSMAKDYIGKQLRNPTMKLSTQVSFALRVAKEIEHVRRNFESPPADENKLAFFWQKVYPPLILVDMPPKLIAPIKIDELFKARERIIGPELPAQNGLFVKLGRMISRFCADRRNLKISLYAILWDLFDCSDGFPKLDSGHLLREDISNLKFVILTQMDVEHLPETNSATLTLIWYHLARRFESVINKGRSTRCLSASKVIFSLSAAIPHETGDELIKIKLKKFLGDRRAQANSHNLEDTPTFATAHAVSASTLCCGSCFESFIQQEEFDFLLADANSGRSKTILSTLKRRKAEHFQKHYNGNRRDGMFGKHSTFANLHRHVRDVFSMVSEVSSIERGHILDVIRRIRCQGFRGSMSENSFVQTVASLGVDYISKKRNGLKMINTISGAGATHATMLPRVMAEVKYIKREYPSNVAWSREFWEIVYPILKVPHPLLPSPDLAAPLTFEEFLDTI